MIAKKEMADTAKEVVDATKRRLINRSFSSIITSDEEVVFMSMTASDLQNLNDVVNNLRKAWEGMTREQRNMVKTMVDLVAKTEEDNAIASLYEPLTREEMLASIDRGLAEADRGEGQPLEEVGAELAAEFGFVR